MVQTPPFFIGDAYYHRRSLNAFAQLESFWYLYRTGLMFPGSAGSAWNEQIKKDVARQTVSSR